MALERIGLDWMARGTSHVLMILWRGVVSVCKLFSTCDSAELDIASHFWFLQCVVVNIPRCPDRM